jgi:hypothetical protein
MRKELSVAAQEADEIRQQATVPSDNTDANSRINDCHRMESMFDYLEKKSQKRVFYSYLRQFELTVEDLGTRVARQLVNMVHDESCKVAQAFNEPLSSVSHRIISAAAWSTIYCVLGPDRMRQIHPDYRDIVDEVERELVASSSDLILETSVYHRVYDILMRHALCHPDVIALSEACALPELTRETSDAERVHFGLSQG